MKTRELIVWVVLLILILLLLRTCNIKSGSINNVKTIYVQGKSDTIIKIKTVEAVKFIDRPIPYYVYIGDSAKIKMCDSIRLYSDSLVTADGIASVQSSVRGELLDQHIGMKIFNHDTTFNRIDTIKETIFNPEQFSLNITGSVDLKNGPGMGASISLNRLNIGYQYFPITRSNQLQIAYKLIRR